MNTLTANQQTKFKAARDRVRPQPKVEGTELAAARDIARLHGHRIRFCVDAGQFLCFEGVWMPDRTGTVIRLAKDIATDEGRLAHMSKKERARAVQKLQSSSGVNGVVKLLSTEPGIPVTADELDSHPFLLACENGTVDLKTGRLRPHRPEDLLTKLTSTIFDPRAKCPTWDAFLRRSMGDNAALIAYLQRLAGLCMTGDPTVQELFIFHGDGNNGKSVFIDTLLAIMASHGGVAPESLLLDQKYATHPTEIADLQGKRMVVASETESGAKLRLQMVKRLTGDSVLKARKMRQDFYEFRRTHKLILVSNNRPAIPESTEAAWRRIRLIPFEVVIPPEERDPHLLEKLRAEWPGILAWAVRGCLEWQRTGMNPPKEVLAATEDYRSDSDPLFDYLADRTIQLADSRVSRADLFIDYAQWAAKTGINERDRLDRASLFDRVRRICPDGVWKVDGKTVRGFQGISLCFGSNAA